MGSNTPGAASSAADYLIVGGDILGQLGSILEAQEAPKSRPKREKIDVKKQHVFEIDFWVARAWFLNGFWMVFWTPNPCKKLFEEKRPRAILYCKNQCGIDVDTFAREGFSNKNQ